MFQTSEVQSMVLYSSMPFTHVTFRLKRLFISFPQPLPTMPSISESTKRKRTTSLDDDEPKPKPLEFLYLVYEKKPTQSSLKRRRLDFATPDPGVTTVGRSSNQNKKTADALQRVYDYEYVSWGGGFSKYRRVPGRDHPMYSASRNIKGSKPTAFPNGKRVLSEVSSFKKHISR
jgi:hypothetical protein